MKWGDVGGFRECSQYRTPEGDFPWVYMWETRAWLGGRSSAGEKEVPS